MKKISIHFRAHFDPYWYPYFVYIGSEHNKTFMISVFLFCFTIHWVYKDWMLKTDETLTMEDGRRYVTWTKNPDYMDEEVKTFALPKWW